MATHFGIAMPKLGCVYPDTEPWSAKGRADHGALARLAKPY